jgi:hypothetical protein
VYIYMLCVVGAVLMGQAAEKVVRSQDRRTDGGPSNSYIHWQERVRRGRRERAPDEKG